MKPLDEHEEMILSLIRGRSISPEMALYLVRAYANHDTDTLFNMTAAVAESRRHRIREYMLDPDYTQHCHASPDHYQMSFLDSAGGIIPQ